MQAGEELFIQGVELMLAGIGSVFVFLILLVLSTRLMSWALMRLAPARVDELPKEKVAAIGAAVSAYRRRKESG